MSERLAAWRKATAPREIDLGDGLTVLVRRVRLQDLIVTGSVPVTLIDDAAAAQKRLTKKGRATADDTRQILPMIDAVVLAVVIDPPLALVADDDHLALESISPDQRMKIFEAVNSEAAALRPFRGQPDGDEAAARGGDDVPQEAVGDSGD